MPMFSGMQANRWYHLIPAWSEIGAYTRVYDAGTDANLTHHWVIMTQLYNESEE